MMEGLSREKREGLILASLLERRVRVEEEGRQLRTQIAEASRRELEMKEEIITLDAILGAVPEPPPIPVPTADSSLAPSTPGSDVVPAARKRRRQGSRRESMLPRMREKLGTGVFAVDDVLDLLLQEEPGERRKVYFAAWALVRDLLQDEILGVVTEEGTGPRKKRTFRFRSGEGEGKAPQGPPPIPTN